MVMAAGQDVMNVLKVGLEDLLEGFETEYRRFQNGLGVRNQRWGFATNDQRSYFPPLTEARRASTGESKRERRRARA